MPTSTNIGNCCGCDGGGGGSCVACSLAHTIEIDAPCLGLVDHVPGHVCSPPPPGDGDYWIVGSVFNTCASDAVLEFDIYCTAGVFTLAWEIIKDAVTCDFGTVEGTVASTDPLDVTFQFSPNASCCPCGDNTITVNLLG